MSSRTLLNLTLALIFSGLILLTIFEPGKDDTPEFTSLSLLTSDEIQAIQLQSPGQADIQLHKIDTIWHMIKPFSTMANQERISQLLKLLNAKSQASYAFKQVNGHELQLDAPFLTLHFNDFRFDLGGTAPLGGSRYVRIDDTVHLFSDRYSHLVRGPATGLVSPTLLNPSHSITELHLPSLDLLLHDGQWKTSKSQTTHSYNPDHIQQLLDEWRHARAFSVQPLLITSKKLDTVTITTNLTSLQFKLLITDDELILQRHDLGLQFHFPLETTQRLLELPKIKDA